MLGQPKACKFPAFRMRCEIYRVVKGFCGGKIEDAKTVWLGSPRLLFAVLYQGEDKQTTHFANRSATQCFAALTI